MSARDAESGSSTYKGGSGRAGGLGNGGLGGGMGGGGNYGGGMGGGAARYGGLGNRTGLTTGNRMVGIPGRDGLTFRGRPGGFAQQPGAFGIQSLPAVSSAPLTRPTVPGILGPAAPSVVPQIEDVPMPPMPAPYNPLTSIQQPMPPAYPPTSYYMADRIRPIDRLAKAVQVPALSNISQMSPYSNSIYGNPQYGMPSGGGSLAGYAGQSVNRTGKGGLER